MRSLPMLRILLLTSLGCKGQVIVCDDPVDLGEGYVRCADGAVNRVGAEPADPFVNRFPVCDGTEGDVQCTTDADCTAGPYGLCGRQQTFDGGYICGCTYACSTDADCTTGEACLTSAQVAGERWARCVPASCTTNDDCDSEACGVSNYNNGCGTFHRLECRSKEDSCASDADCGGTCGVDPDIPEYFECSETSCVVGRPFVVQNIPRMAPTLSREDWSGDAPEVPHDLELAAHWASTAAAEHASVASFNVVSLQLMALGAPPELLHATQQAAQDEIRHARTMYALTSAAGGTTVGPGPLPVSGLSIRSEPVAFLEALIEDACVNETLSAALASFEASTVVDPRLRALLHGIADDEQEHAALAWRTLRWFIDTHPALRSHAVAHLRAHLARVRATEPPSSLHRPELGVHGSEARGAHQRRVIDEVLAPCITALEAGPWVRPDERDFSGRLTEAVQQL